MPLDAVPLGNAAMHEDDEATAPANVNQRGGQRKWMLRGEKWVQVDNDGVIDVNLDYNASTCSALTPACSGDAVDVADAADDGFRSALARRRVKTDAEVEFLKIADVVEGNDMSVEPRTSTRSGKSDPADAAAAARLGFMKKKITYESRDVAATISELRLGMDIAKKGLADGIAAREALEDALNCECVAREAMKKELMQIVLDEQHARKDQLDQESMAREHTMSQLDLKLDSQQSMFSEEVVSIRTQMEEALREAQLVMNERIEAFEREFSTQINSKLSTLTVGLGDLEDTCRDFSMRLENNDSRVQLIQKDFLSYGEDQGSLAGEFERCKVRLEEIEKGVKKHADADAILATRFDDLRSFLEMLQDKTEKNQDALKTRIETIGSVLEKREHLVSDAESIKAVMDTLEKTVHQNGIKSEGFALQIDGIIGHLQVLDDSAKLCQEHHRTLTTRMDKAESMTFEVACFASRAEDAAARLENLENKFNECEKASSRFEDIDLRLQTFFEIMSELQNQHKSLEARTEEIRDFIGTSSEQLAGKIRDIAGLSKAAVEREINNRETACRQMFERIQELQLSHSVSVGKTAIMEEHLADTNAAATKAVEGLQKIAEVEGAFEERTAAIESHMQTIEAHLENDIEAHVALVAHVEHVGSRVETIEHNMLAQFELQTASINRLDDLVTTLSNESVPRLESLERIAQEQQVFHEKLHANLDEARVCWEEQALRIEASLRNEIQAMINEHVVITEMLKREKDAREVAVIDLVQQLESASSLTEQLPLQLDEERRAREDAVLNMTNKLVTRVDELRRETLALVGTLETETCNRMRKDIDHASSLTERVLERLEEEGRTREDVQQQISNMQKQREEELRKEISVLRNAFETETCNGMRREIDHISSLTERMLERLEEECRAREDAYHQVTNQLVQRDEEVRKETLALIRALETETCHGMRKDIDHVLRLVESVPTVEQQNFVLDKALEANSNKEVLARERALQDMGEEFNRQLDSKHSCWRDHLAEELRLQTEDLKNDVIAHAMSVAEVRQNQDRMNSLIREVIEGLASQRQVHAELNDKLKASIPYQDAMRAVQELRADIELKHKKVEQHAKAFGTSVTAELERLQEKLDTHAKITFNLQDASDQHRNALHQESVARQSSLDYLDSRLGSVSKLEELVRQLAEECSLCKNVIEEHHDYQRKEFAQQLSEEISLRQQSQLEVVHRIKVLENNDCYSHLVRQVQSEHAHLEEAIQKEARARQIDIADLKKQHDPDECKHMVQKMLEDFQHKFEMHVSMCEKAFANQQVRQRIPSEMDKPISVEGTLCISDSHPSSPKGVDNMLSDSVAERLTEDQELWERRFKALRHEMEKKLADGLEREQWQRCKVMEVLKHRIGHERKHRKESAQSHIASKILNTVPEDGIEHMVDRRQTAKPFNDIRPSRRHGEHQGPYQTVCYPFLLSTAGGIKHVGTPPPHPQQPSPDVTTSPRERPLSSPGSVPLPNGHHNQHQIHGIPFVFPTSVARKQAGRTPPAPPLPAPDGTPKLPEPPPALPLPATAGTPMLHDSPPAPSPPSWPLSTTKDMPMLYEPPYTLPSPARGGAPKLSEHPPPLALPTLDGASRLPEPPISPADLPPAFPSFPMPT